MLMPQSSGIVRITKSRDEIEQATQVALERTREGYSPEALVMAVDEILQDDALSRAIVLYVRSSSVEDKDSDTDRPFSWFLVLVSAGFSASCAWMVYFLFTLVGPTSTFLNVLVLVLAQGLLLGLARRSLGQALITACDGLNAASYPTNLHPAKNASLVLGSLRLRRLRALIADTADRIVAGDKPKDLAEELAVLNLTLPAAKCVVGLAVVSAAVRDFIPPYKSPWLGYSVALVFMCTCIAFFEIAGDRVSDGFQNYAAVMAGWIGASLSSRPRKPWVRRGRGV